MIFITEDDLRDLYRKEPFTEYEVGPGTRITPGARQFLADRQIVLYDDENPRNKKVPKVQSSVPSTQTIQPVVVEICGKKLSIRFKSLEAMFLSVAEELLNRDILLAQKIISLKKSFSDIKKALDEGKACSSLACEACTGINEENFSDDLGDCFEITEFHIQLGKGKEIINLHKLRCALREMELDILEAFDGGDGNTQCEDVIGKVNQIVNTLSQLICYTAGGEKCQRKM